MFVSYRFELVKRLSTNNWDFGNPITIAEFEAPKISVRLDDERNSFSIDLSNFNNKWLREISPRDIVTVSRVVNSSVFSQSDVLLQGLINNNGVVVDSSTNRVKVEGYDYSDTVMMAITNVDAKNLTIPEMFIESLNFINSAAPSFGVTWDSGNPLLNSKDESFPLVGRRIFNKSMREALIKWSNKERTEDVNYHWYVTPERKLIWRPSSKDVSFVFDYEADDFLELKDGKDVNDVRNYVIVKGGRDPAGKQIQTYVQDLSSISRHGQRFRILSDVSRDAEFLNKQDMDSLGIEGERFPDSYPFTTTWPSLDNLDSGGNPQPVTVNTNEEYVAAIRNHTTINIKQVGRDYVETHKYGKYELEVSFVPGKGWQLGDLIDVASYPFPDGSSSKTLRVYGVDYDVDIDTFFLSEDLGSV